MKVSSILTITVSSTVVWSSTIGLFARDDPGKHIGYRVVKPKEAESIAQAGGKAVEFNSGGATQLGKAIYISPKFQDFKHSTQTNKEDPRWDCQVFVDAAAWGNFKRVWIPRHYDFPGREPPVPDPAKPEKDCEPPRLWGNRPHQQKNRQDFVDLMYPIREPANTLLYSRIEGHLEKTQIAISFPTIKREVFFMKCADRDFPDEVAKLDRGPVPWDAEIDGMPGLSLGSDIPIVV